MTTGLAVMRAVVDTTILIRALIKPRGTVGHVLTRLAEGQYVIVKLVLPRIHAKYAIDAQTIETTVALLALRGELVHPTRTVKACRAKTIC
jgi:predicted nucleic acid-binding protein